MTLNQTQNPGDWNFTDADDRELIFILKDEIRNAIECRRVYLDSNDVEIAVEIIYPIVFNIVFNSTYFQFRNDKDGIRDLIGYLVSNLA